MRLLDQEDNIIAEALSITYNNQREGWEVEDTLGVVLNCFKDTGKLYRVESDSVPITSVSPVEFKLLFTSAERIVLKNSTDPIVVDLLDIINDTKLTFVNLELQSTKDALDYLVYVSIITAERKAEILTGIVN